MITANQEPSHDDFVARDRVVAARLSSQIDWVISLRRDNDTPNPITNIE